MERARLVLAGLLLSLFGVSPFGVSPPPLLCPLLDERGSPAPCPAHLRILGGPGAPPDPPEDPESTFDVTDSWGVLDGFWGPPWTPPRCELSPTAPLLPPPPGPLPQCHPGLGTRWWLLALGTERGEGTLLLSQGGAGGHPQSLNASLFISTLTPSVRGLVGTPQTLHCSFSPGDGPFTLEWLHHRDGATRRLLAFDSATSRVTEATPGVLLLLGGQDHPKNSGPPGGAQEVSLQLPPLSVSDGGSFVCSVATPHGQLQQVLRMDVIAPPQVSLLPSPLSPGVSAELLCEAVGFFPLDVAMRWERQARGQPRPLEVTAGVTWSSGHRQLADGTFSRTSVLRVAPGTPGDRYSCLVTHTAWDRPHRVTVEVAGATEPSLEDMAGMALVAFVIGGLCVRMWPPAGR